jgi:hypothetical protein
MSGLETIGNVSNGAGEVIEFQAPYTVEAVIEGTAALLFHRWNVDAVEAKSKAAKGSKAKKEDDLESYVYRTDKGHLAIPGEYFRQSIIHAAKFMQDPRSPRKSAMDLFKAGIVALDELCSFGTKDWDYLDRRRVLVQRNGITRVRPAMNKGWKVTVNIMIILPEYIESHLLHDRLNAAGRLIGVGDFRPTFGRFQINGFKVLKD